MKTLEDIFVRHALFSIDTFVGESPTQSLLKLRDEIEEVEEKLSLKASALTLADEYADCIFCILSSAVRAGVKVDELHSAMEWKLFINEGRKWAKNANGTYSHTK